MPLAAGPANPEYRKVGYADGHGVGKLFQVLGVGRKPMRCSFLELHPCNGRKLLFRIFPLRGDNLGWPIEGQLDAPMADIPFLCVLIQFLCGGAAGLCT